MILHKTTWKFKEENEVLPWFNLNPSYADDVHIYIDIRMDVITFYASKAAERKDDAKNLRKLQGYISTAANSKNTYGIPDSFRLIQGMVRMNKKPHCIHLV